MQVAGYHFFFIVHRKQGVIEDFKSGEGCIEGAAIRLMDRVKEECSKRGKLSFLDNRRETLKKGGKKTCIQ